MDCEQLEDSGIITGKDLLNNSFTFKTLKYYSFSQAVPLEKLGLQANFLLVLTLSFIVTHLTKTVKTLTLTHQDQLIKQVLVMSIRRMRSCV